MNEKKSGLHSEKYVLKIIWNGRHNMQSDFFYPMLKFTYWSYFFAHATCLQCLVRTGAELHFRPGLPLALIESEAVPMKYIQLRSSLTHMDRGQ